MKILITVIALQFITVCLFAQHSILNTKWRGRIESPQALDIIFDFKKDTVIVWSAEGQELESMFFSQNKDTVLIRKLSGTSPCDYGAEGYYHIEWQENGEKLKFHTLRDICSERSGAITSAPVYFRVKD